MGQKVAQSAGKETAKNVQSQQTVVAEGQKPKLQGREAALLNLQRTHGNRHVNQMLKGGILQRQCSACGKEIAGGECVECGKTKGGLQRKLAIGASNDPLELEADRVAYQVMASPAHTAISGTPPRIQRFTGQTAGQADMEAPASVDRVLSSSGSPLEPALKQDMEQRFGQDFSQVRVHTDAAAGRSALDVNANAYTVGQDIVFGAGRFAPGTNEGRRLIAHELTHVLQQSDSDGIRGGENNSLMQKSKGIAKLQRQLRSNENNGGCGICTSPSVTGTLAHSYVQFMFGLTYGRHIVPEAKFFNPGDKDRRLDLMRIIKSATPPVIIEIGEIKPDNNEGRKEGKRDLEFYKSAVQAHFPGPHFHVEFMTLPAPQVSVPFTDAPPGSQCPFQDLSIRNTRLGGQPGLYLYSCTPSGSQINESCCGQIQPVNIPATSDIDEKDKEEKTIPEPTTNPELQPAAAKTFEQPIRDFIREVIDGGQDIKKAVQKFLNDHPEIVQNIELIIAAGFAGAILSDIVSLGGAIAKDPLVMAILSTMYSIARTMRAAL